MFVRPRSIRFVVVQLFNDTHYLFAVNDNNHRKNFLLSNAYIHMQKKAC